MPKLVVASVQQQMRLFESLEDYRKEVNRFLYLARAKGAKLVVFPALTGVMAAAPQAEGFRVNLLRRADERNRRQKTLWSRTRSALAGSTANLLKVSFRKAFVALAADDPDALRVPYEAVFASLAQAYGITIVAGSAYLPDGGGRLRQRAQVFGPNGETLGRHDKLVMSAEDEGLAEPGSDWTVVDTPAGRLGILLGEEALYPEAGRILAYQGAEILIALGATSSEATAAYLRHAAVSRAQENQCFSLSSFLVGTNYLAEKGADGNADFLGKSGIYAPLEMTPRFSGILVEMGTASSEGLLTAELDRDGLEALWESGTQPLRHRAPVQVFANYLPPLYGSLRTLGEAAAEASRVPAAVQQARLLGPELPGLPPAIEHVQAEIAGQNLPSSETPPIPPAAPEPEQGAEASVEQPDSDTLPPVDSYAAGTVEAVADPAIEPTAEGPAAEGPAGAESGAADAPETTEDAPEPSEPATGDKDEAGRSL